MIRVFVDTSYAHIHMTPQERRAAAVEATLSGELCEYKPEPGDFDLLDGNCRLPRQCVVTDGRLNSDTYCTSLRVCAKHARQIWQGGSVEINGQLYYVYKYRELSDLLARKLDA